MGSLRDQLRGFPAWQMCIVCLMRFSEPIAFTSLFPYVYFMVRDFNITEDPTQISKYTGYMGASFAFSQFLCCVHWGRLSDKIGRKPVLLMGLLGTMTSLLIFGFCTNFYMAIAARTLMGALNGNMPVLQTMVGEIATDKKHQSLAFSLIPLIWNIGSVIGPAIGGSKYLTRPKMTTEEYEGDGAYYRFIEKYPYAMSNVVVASLLLFSALIGFLFLEETEPSARLRHDYGLELCQRLLRCVGLTRSIQLPDDDMRERIYGEALDVISLHTTKAFRPMDDELIGEDDLSEVSDSYQSPLTRRSSLAFIRRYSTTFLSENSMKEDSKNVFKALADKSIFNSKVRGTIFTYFCLSFHCLVFTEFLPVFLAGNYQVELLKFPWHIQGGMSWDTSDIGFLLSTTGLSGCLIIVFLFPYLDRHMRKIDVFRTGSYFFPVLYILIPYVVFTKTDFLPKLPSWFSTFATYTIVSLQSFAAALAFPQMVILLYRATLPQHRALVNGTSMSATALARCVAPVIWGTLISFFDSKGIAEVSWLILAVIASLTLVLAFQLDEYDEDLQVNNVEEEAAEELLPYDLL